ncbi:MAG: hypothetical protein ACR2G2_14640, partial [Pseudonocardia sp.]
MHANDRRTVTAADFTADPIYNLERGPNAGLWHVSALGEVIGHRVPHLDRPRGDPAGTERTVAGRPGQRAGHRRLHDRAPTRCVKQCWTRWGGQVERHPAQWQRHGRGAGYRRNSDLVALGADECVAFIQDSSPGGQPHRAPRPRVLHPHHRAHHH